MSEDYQPNYALKRSHAKVGGANLREQADGKEFHMADQPRKDGSHQPSGDDENCGDEPCELDSEGVDDIIDISDDDQEMLDDCDEPFEESSNDEEEDSDEDWQGIAKFLGDDLIEKLRNKKK